MRSQVLARLSISLHGDEALSRRGETAAEAESIARDAGDPPTLLYALFARHRSLWAPGFREKRLPVAKEIEAVASQLGGNITAPAITYRIYDSLEAGDILTVDELIARFEDLASLLHQPQRSSVLKNLQTARALVDGRLGDAERLNEQARQVGESSAPTLTDADHYLFRFFLFREQGKLDELPSAPGLRHLDDVFRATINLILATETELNHPRPLSLDELIARICLKTSQDGNAVAAGTLIATSADLVQRPDLANDLYVALAPYAHLNAVLPNSRHFHCIGPIAQALGLLAGALGQWDSAEQHFRRAIEMNSRMEAIPYLAHSRYQFARMLAIRDSAGDRARAGRIARLARESADALGMVVLAEQSRALLDELKRK